MRRSASCLRSPLRPIKGGLEAQLEALQSQTTDKPESAAKIEDERRSPKRQVLPAHLRRVDHHHEPEQTTCGCGQAMVRVGEDVSERLDIVPAEFFVPGRWYRGPALASLNRPSGLLSAGSASPYPWQVGMQVLPDPNARTGGTAHHR